MEKRITVDRKDLGYSVGKLNSQGYTIESIKDMGYKYYGSDYEGRNVWGDKEFKIVATRENVIKDWDY